MKVYALYGASGTGKSTQALSVAHELHIPAIIDDGLLIYQGHKVAGYSAKYEKTKIAAIKRAIFQNPLHREELRSRLEQLSPPSILIMGTSKEMVDQIAKRLELPPISRYIAIEDICQEHEIRQALFVRKFLGRHAIPISQIQVERHLVGKLIANVEKIFSAKREEIGERTIVYPPFHKNKITIHESALKKLVNLQLRDEKAIHSISGIHVDDKYYSYVTLNLTLQVHFGESLPVIARSIQQKIYQLFLVHLNVELQYVKLNIQHVKVSMDSRKGHVSRKKSTSA